MGRLAEKLKCVVYKRTRKEIVAIMRQRGFPETDQSVRYTLDKLHAQLAENEDIKKLAVEVGLWPRGE